MEVVVEEGRKGKTQRHPGLAGRRHNAGNQPHQIVEQHKEEDAGDEGLKALIAVANDLFGLAADCLVDILGNPLRRVGLLHRQAYPYDHEKEDETCDHQKLQPERLIDRNGLVSGNRLMKANRLKSLDLDAQEEFVQQTNECESFRH